MLDPQIKSLWLAALRSGKYKQTRGKLFDGDDFCCLGVLCDTLQPGAWQVVDGGFVHPLDDHRENDREGPFILDSLLSIEFCYQIGLTIDEMCTLTALNDGEKSPLMEIPECDFLTIANWIEEHL